jgi:AraC-like DNA-binding protein
MLNFDSFNLILFILPVYQLLFYVVQLITLRRKNNPSRLPLGFLMLLMLVYVMINASRYLGYSEVYKYLFIFQLPVLLAIIPTYCVYFRQLSSASGGIFSKPIWFCFMPAGLILVLNVISFIMMDQVQMKHFLVSGGSLFSVVQDATGFATVLFLAGNVLAVTLQVIIAPFQYKKMMNNLEETWREDSSFLAHFQSSWSNLIFFAILVFVLLNSLMNFFVPAYNSLQSAFFNIGVLIASGIAGYLSLKQDKLYLEVANVLVNRDVMDKVKRDKQDQELKEESVSEFKISKEEIDSIINSLQNYMANDKPYLECKLRVVDVARKIGVSRHKLTYVINHEMNTNFYGLINNHRIIEAKWMLKQPENHKYNIDAIAEMVGFQSKSSFNGCFRKITGVTPSQYRKNRGGFKAS